MARIFAWKMKPLPRPNMKLTEITAFGLTLLYALEVCLGVRCVVFVFDVWNKARLSPPLSDDISWTLMVISLMLCVFTCCAVNSISALWESKNYEGMKSAIYFCCHILTGGVPSRFLGLWKSQSVEEEKEKVMLIACLKFIFSQFFTIPLIIIHVYLQYEMTELVYDAAAIFSVGLTFVMTCSALHHYPVNVEYPYETMALVPLIFKKFPEQKEEEPQQEKDKVKENQQTKQPNTITHWKLWSFAIVLQYILFSFGRIIAIAVLFKLTGIYALPILFLQFLLSVLYLKFQAVTLVPESLSKPKQLVRLAFLSYVLVFEWQIHRDTRTGYNMLTSIKHGLFYYSIATIESVFYLVVWAVTASKPSTSMFLEVAAVNPEYVLWVASLASLSLLASYSIHVSLVVLQIDSDKILKNFYNNGLLFRTRSIVSKFRNNKCDGKSGNEKTTEPKTTDLPSSSNSEEVVHRKDITDSSTVSNINTANSNSYRDLRESVDDNIEVPQQKPSGYTVEKQAATLVKAPCDVHKLKETKLDSRAPPEYPPIKNSAVTQGLFKCMPESIQKQAKFPFTASELKAMNGKPHNTPESTTSKNFENTDKSVHGSTQLNAKTLKCQNNFKGLKGLKDSNFFKNIKGNNTSKANNNRSWAVHVKEGCGNLGVMKKVGSMTNTVSTHLSKLSLAKSGKNKVNGQSKQDTTVNKIKISTIMNEYKDEIPSNFSSFETDSKEETQQGRNIFENTESKAGVSPSEEVSPVSADGHAGESFRFPKVPVKPTDVISDARRKLLSSSLDSECSESSIQKDRFYDEYNKTDGHVSVSCEDVSAPPSGPRKQQVHARPDKPPPLPPRGPPVRRQRSLTPDVSIDCEDDEEDDVIYDRKEYNDIDCRTADRFENDPNEREDSEEFVERFV